jgi:hypothetical protein
VFMTAFSSQPLGQARRGRQSNQYS